MWALKCSNTFGDSRGKNRLLGIPPGDFLSVVTGQRRLSSDKQRSHQGLIIQPKFSVAYFMHRNIYFFLLHLKILKYIVAAEIFTSITEDGSTQVV